MPRLTLQKRYDAVLTALGEAMPFPQSELTYASPFQLLVAVMLSAQCTDKRVNQVTPALFAAFPTAQQMAQATPEAVLPYIRSVSYPNSKATHLVGMAQRLVSVYGGSVPDNLDDLQTLPGVGRKTANVICAIVFNQPTMAVDTHIFRVAERLGLTTNSKTPLQTEQVLVRHIPQDLIPKAHHWLLLHGRYVCQARQPRCLECPVRAYCRFFATRLKEPPKSKTL